MKRNAGKIIMGATAFLLLTSSCKTLKKTSNRDKGVAIGATSGAVIGGVIGNNVGNGKNTAVGAILGAVVGGVAGGIIGNKMDKQAEKIKDEIPGAKVERIGEGIRVTFDENNPDGSKMGVYFETNKYNISANSQRAIAKMQDIFAEYPETNILIEGHTDDVGTDSYNMKLSQQRAEAVSAALRKEGVASSRLITKWYGETEPVVENTSAANRALNRRVEFVITANEKMKADAKKEAGE